MNRLYFYLSTALIWLAKFSVWCMAFIGVIAAWPLTVPIGVFLLLIIIYSLAEDHLKGKKEHDEREGSKK